MTRLSSGRPAVMLGVRAALATMTPIALGIGLGWEGARWATISGFTAAVVDKGGAYRTRLWAMSSVTLGSALALSVAAHAHGPWSGALVMLVVATIGGLLRVFGPEMASVGTSSCVMLAIALEAHPSTKDLAVDIGGVLGGGAWAIVLAMIFWPIRVYRPARRAVARAYHALAEHTRSLASELSRGDDASWASMLQREHRALRDRLEEARAVLAATRRGNRGESGRGARLLVLFSIAEQTLGGLVGLGDGLEATRDVKNASVLASELEALGVELDRIGREIRIEGPIPHDREPTIRRQPAPLDTDAILFERIRRWLELARDITAGMHDDGPLPSFGSEQVARTVLALSESPLAKLTSALSLDSAILRHAARLGVTAALAVVLARGLHLQRGYWVTLTVIIVLQPYTPETFKKGLQRTLGTIAGAAVVALVVWLVRDPALVLVVAGVLAAASVAVLQLNYALYAFFLTPTFVLLAEINGGDYRLVGVRIANTVLGGALAYLGARLLWPLPENRLFPAEMAVALRKARAFFDAAVTADPTTIGEARRTFGIAINNADASFQRLLSEAGAKPVDMEPRMTLLLFSRRLAASTLRAASTSTLDPSLTRAVDVMLEDIANAVEQNRAPTPLADPRRNLIDDRAFERVALQLRVLHDAATRLATPRLRLERASRPGASTT